MNTSKSPASSCQLNISLLVLCFLTVDLLNALQVVHRQLEVVRVHVLVEGSHDGTGVVGVLQTQSMA